MKRTSPPGELLAKAWSPGLSPSCALASSPRSPSARPRPRKQVARELNSASSDLESKPIPDRDLERGLHAPVIAAVVEHRREPSTCMRAASDSGRTRTPITTFVASHPESFRRRSRRASLVGVEPDVSRFRGERPRPLDESDNSTRGETRTRGPLHVRQMLSPLSYARIIERTEGLEPITARFGRPACDQYTTFA